MRNVRHPPINFSEFDGVRYLHFGSVWVQGAMRMDDPVRLELEYVRQMMAWLLFLDGRQRILQLGLGAGALTRFCHARLPHSRLTVIERSESVVRAVRQFFSLPREGRRLSVKIKDAGRYVQRAPDAAHDVIQVDLYDEDARGPVLDSVEFYGQCSRVLAPVGVIAVNLFGDDQGFAPSFERISQAFGHRVLALPATVAGNRVVLGFKGPRIEVDWSVLERRAAALTQGYGLEAIDWVAALKHDPSTSRQPFII